MYHFRNLVFEGGGVKGIAYTGALEVLEKKGILKEIKRFAGTSAGSITACLLAVGFSPKEIMEILWETDFNKFKDKSNIITNIIKFFKEYGWFKGNAFQNWLEENISRKQNKEITFSQLYKKTGKELHVVGTNLNEKKSKIFSHKTTPNMKISEAVRISMSIPIFFRSINLNNSIFVDGGLYYNYPINIFDNKKYLINKSMFSPVKYDKRKGFVYNKETLGLKVDSSEEIAANLGKINSPPEKINSLKDYLMTVSEGMLEIVNRIHLHRNDWHRTIYINSSDVKTTDFELKDSKKQELVDNGKSGTINYLKWFDNPGKEKPLNK